MVSAPRPGLWALRASVLVAWVKGADKEGKVGNVKENAETMKKEAEEREEKMMETLWLELAFEHSSWRYRQGRVSRSSTAKRMSLDVDYCCSKPRTFARQV